MAERNPPKTFTDRSRITIRVSKQGELWAIIKEPGKMQYSVLVGGPKWKEGIIPKYHQRIIDKCQNFILALQTRLGKTISLTLNENESTLSRT